MKEKLEEIYDIPFGENKSTNGITLWPAGEQVGELFEVDLRVRSGVRLICAIHPQKYAGNMLRTFANAGEEKQKAFTSYLDWFRTNADRVNISFDGKVNDFSTWPDDWHGMEIVIKKLLENEGDEDTLSPIWIEMATGLMLSLLDIVPVENEIRFDVEEEGQEKIVQETRYERSRINRQLCLNKHGYSCQICGVNFEKIYGERGKGFIHVHHIVPVSQMDEAKVLDPVKDLIPVCPNCHAMLHRSDPPMTPDELRRIVETNRKGSA